MNGRMGCAVLRVLGVLALVSVSATAGAAQTQDYPYPTEGTSNEGLYDSGEDAENACMSALSNAGGGDANECSVNNDYHDDAVLWVSYDDDNEWDQWGTVHLYFYQECPDGETRNAEGQCEEECPNGTIQDGPNAGDCREDCGEVANGDNDYWGTGGHEDFTAVKPSCDSQTGCTVTPQRFHELVDGTVTAEWTHTGDQCSSEGSYIGSGTANEDGCVGTGSAEFCYEDFGQDSNCGNFNGERVCFGAVPENGTCTGADGPGSSYTCATQGDYSVIPELPDGQTAEEDAAVTMATAEAEANVTVSGGSVVEGDAPLDETQPPTEGEEGAGDHDGTGDGEGEEDGLCDKAPHLCEEGEADVGDKDVPEESSNIGDLVGGGDYPNVLSGSGGCPEPQTVNLPDSLGGGVLEIPFTAFCDMAEILRPLVIALAYLTAFYAAVRILA